MATVAIFAFCLWAHPPAIWCALIALLVSAILAAELFNTSLEMLIDVLHPDLHPMIGQAKDCAAGAVFVLSLSSLIVFVALLLELYT